MNRISPPSGYKEPKRMPWSEIGIGCLFLVLLALVLKPSCAYVRIRPRTPYALSNIKQAGLAIIMFENDYNDSAPEMANFPVFQAMVMPYLRNPSTLIDPDTGRPFTPNQKLSRIDMSKLKDPATTILLYDADPANGMRLVAFADGHVKKIPEADFQKEISFDPHAPHDLGLYEGKWQTPIGQVRIDMSGGAMLQVLVAKNDLKGKLTVDDKDNLSITFGPHKPSIVGKETWLSIDDLSVKTAGSGEIRMTRLP